MRNDSMEMSVDIRRERKRERAKQVAILTGFAVERGEYYSLDHLIFCVLPLLAGMIRLSLLPLFVCSFPHPPSLLFVQTLSLSHQE